MSKKQIKLGFSIWPTGRHASAWRLPGADATGSVDPGALQRAAKRVEAAKFDYFFIGNRLASDPAAETSLHLNVFKIDAFTLAAYVAAVTDRIGIVATVNANFIDPYSTARSAASVDHLSRGRHAVNFITSKEAGVNYGLGKDFPSDYERYTELLEIIQGLWDSWEDGAVVADKEGGQWVDHAKAHRIDYAGKHYQVQGPLNIPRPPQGQVPIVHAGASDDSKEFGARFADIRFSPFVDIEWNQLYYQDVKSRLAKYGRDRDDQYILPGITFYAAETSREAHARYREVQELVVAAYDAHGVGLRLGIDATSIDPSTRVRDVVDIPNLPRVLDPGPAGVFAAQDKGSFIRLLQRAYGEEDITLRDVHNAAANGPYPQAPIVGSYQEVADFLENAVDGEAIDGAVLFPAYLPGALDDFTSLVVPELQRRGRFRREYETATFREHFDLPAIPNRFAAVPVGV
ncbi:MAG TPA: NtaA/DmoA family FMN-dependent monooxygenase [Microbacteriaceae bacterium]|nr:NtaA/DmoA family FMN-dependent monooxygenase [Microbacteriaceae bacterium]